MSLKRCPMDECRPDRLGFCTECGHEVLSDRPDPETPAPEVEGATVEELQAVPLGCWVVDAVGDRWLKFQPDLWEYDAQHDWLNSYELDRVWGPITIEETP